MKKLSAWFDDNWWAGLAIAALLIMFGQWYFGIMAEW